MKQNLTQRFIYITMFLLFCCSTIQTEAQVTVTTFAGSVSPTTGYVNGQDTAARFNGASGLSSDNLGNVYVADQYNNRIRKITPNGLVSNYAGSGVTWPYVYSHVSISTLERPTRLFITDAGEMVIASRNASRMYQVKNDTLYYPGWSSTTAASGVVIDKQGNTFYIQDVDGMIRKIDTAGNLTIFAGSSTGYLDGPSTVAKFGQLFGLTIDSSDNLYVGDLFNNRIRKITPSGFVSTVAGSATMGILDGPVSTALLNGPTSLCMEKSTGILYFIDARSSGGSPITGQMIRKIDPSGQVGTVAGSSTRGYVDGATSSARFWDILGINVTSSGIIYVSERVGTRIRRIGSPLCLATTATLTPSICSGATYTSPSTNYTWTTSGTYMDTLTNAGGCDSVITINLTVNPTPTVVTTPSLQGVCSGVAITSMILSGNVASGVVYNWTRDNTTTATGIAASGVGNISGTLTNTGTTPVTVTFTITPTANGCTGTPIMATVKVNPIPDVTQPINQVLCNNAVTNLVNFTGTVPGTGFNWTNSDPSIGLAASGCGDIASFTVTNTGTTPVVATVSVTPKTGDLAYIPNLGPNTVSVINTACNTVVDTIPVGTDPHGIAVSHDGSRVYVANNTSGDVSVINTATNLVIATVNVGTGPASLVVSPDGSRVYVTNGGSNNVSVIETATNTVLGSFISVGNAPAGIAVSPDGSQVYVANHLAHTVSVIETITNTVVATVPTGGTRPWGLTYSPDGSLVYVANSVSDNISIFETVGNTLLTIVSGGDSPFDVTASLDGSRVYVSNVNDGDVSVIETATNTVLTTVSVGGGFPTGISVSPDGGLVYVAKSGHHSIAVINTATNSVVATVPLGGGATPVAPGNFFSNISTVCTGPTKTFTYTVNPVSANSISASACNTYTSPSTNYTWTTSGTYMDTLTNTFGCDSVLTIALTINNSTTNSISATACNTYTSPSTNYTWTTSGTYQDTLTNAAGCDSVLTIALTINNSTSNSISATACNTYTSPSTNYTWTTSGTYQDTLTNANGCDSVLTIALTINNSTSNSISATACNTYTSPSSNYTWTTSGTYQDTLTNANGCDSVLTIALTINNSTSNSISATSCNTYTSPSSNYTWTTSGTYMDTLTNANGCDSVLTISLTINSLPTVTITTSPNDTICSGGSLTLSGSGASTYSWTGGITDNTSFIPTSSGTYTVTGIDANGCSNTAVQNIELSPNPTAMIVGLTPGTSVVKNTTVSTFAGSSPGFANFTNARFNLPWSIAIQKSNNRAYVADYSNHRIRLILPNGYTYSYGNGAAGFADGGSTTAKFNRPRGIAVTNNGTVYVADEFNHRIRKMNSSGLVTTLAGSTQGFADGTGSNAKLNRPSGVTVDANGTVYVADRGNHRIRKISPTGVVTTIAGSAAGFADGTGTAAMFLSPTGIVVDTTGTLYVTDYGNHRIRKITPSGVVTTFAGSTLGSADGIGTAASFNNPEHLTIDDLGNLYIADRFNHKIRKITPGGVVTTVAGSTQGSQNGTEITAQFNQPSAVAINNQGELLVTDLFNHRIRKIVIDYPSVNTICAGDTLKLAAVSDASSYTWSPTTNLFSASGNSALVSSSASGAYAVTVATAFGCTATDTFNIVVNSKPTITVNASPNDTLCANTALTLSGSGASTYSWTGGITNNTIFTPTGSGSYTVTGVDANGCSNTTVQNIVVKSISINSISATACNTYTSPSSNYTWTTSGTYQDTLINTNGCDSVLTIALTINNSTSNFISATACNTYTSPSTNYTWTTSGTYQDTLTNASGCDSVLTIALTINNSTSNSISATACNTYTSPSSNYTWTTSGTYQDTLTNANGCDSVLAIALTINNSTSNSISATACNTYTSPSSNYTWTTSGTHQDTLTNANGCDSVLTIALTINNSTSNSISATACNTYTSPSANYTWTTSGTYQDTLTNASGCDSVLTIALTINNSTSNSISATACNTYTSPSSNYTWTTSGTYQDTLTNSNGCDSVLTIALTINNSTSNSISATACNTYTSPSANYTWTTSGTYQDTLTNSNGCDSVLTIALTINNSTSNSISATACNTYTSPSANYTWTTSGTYQDTLTNASGCDSVLTIALTINNSTSNSISATACNTYTSPSSNYTWTTSGTYQDTLTNANGCDSVLTIALTINNSTSNSISATACNTYTSPSSNYTWTTSGTYQDTLTNANGCDSVLSIALTINNSSTNSISATACNTYTSPSSNYTWTTSGTYMDTLTNANGCDSVLTIALTINNFTSNSISATACNTYTSPSTNYTWTTSGTYQDTLTNANGCDSVLTIALTINNSTSNSISATSCNTYTSPSSNYTWTTSGTYQDTLTNANGCDSVLTIALTINNSTSNSISATACNTYISPSSNYTWTTSGTYQDTLTNANGCDSVLTIALTINNSTSNSINATACNTYTSPSSNYTWTTSGTYQDTLTNANGCDSVLTIALTINNSMSATISPVACNTYTSPSSNYTWTTSGTYMDTVLTVAGCDSILTINLTINTSPTIVVSPTTVTTCSTSSSHIVASGAVAYIWMPGSINGNTLLLPANATSGTYTVTGLAANGCTGTASVAVTVSAINGNLSQAMTSNSASIAGTQIDSAIQPNNGQTYSYFDGSCNIIASVQEAAGGGSLGMVTSAVTVAAATPVYQGQPYIARWYDISPENQGPANVTLYFTDDDFIVYNANNGSFPNVATNAGSATTTTNLAISKTNGPLGTNTTTVINVTANWNAATSRWEITFPVTGFSQFRLHARNPGNAALPVEYKNFSVRKLGNSDIVEWTTVNELNNKHFSIQRSTDGQNFVTLGQVKTKALNGVSSSELSYDFIDANPQTGHNYYRLAQVDIDQNTRYTEVIDIVWGTAGSVVKVYPNPTQDKLNIDLSTDKVTQLEIRLLDMSGRVVKSVLTKSVKGLNNITLSLDEIADGIYGIQIYENNQLTHINKVRKN